MLSSVVELAVQSWMWGLLAGRVRTFRIRIKGNLLCQIYVEKAMM